MQLASVPFARKQGVIFDDAALKHRQVSLTLLDSRSNHGLILRRGVGLSDRVSGRAIASRVDGVSPSWSVHGALRVVAAGLRCGRRVGSGGETSQYCGGDLTGFFLADQLLVGDHLNTSELAANIFSRLDIGHSKLHWRAA